MHRSEAVEKLQELVVYLKSASRTISLRNCADELEAAAKMLAKIAKEAKEEKERKE